MAESKSVEHSEASKAIESNAITLVVIDTHPIPTLADAYEDYKRYKRNLSKITLKGYDQVMRTAFNKMSKKLITEITREECLALHDKISNTGSNYGSGQAQADRAFRTLRAVLNWSRHRFTNEDGNPILLCNPVDILSQLKAWNKRKPRQNMIKQYQFPVWWRAVCELRDQSVSDWLKLLVLTGLRKSEALFLKWEDVDFFERTISIIRTKTGKPHLLPMSDYLYALLMHRFKNRPMIQGGHANPYVFHSTYTNARGGALSGDHVKGIDKITEYTGIVWTPHDLRRTFASAVVECQLSEVMLKQLMNHAGSVNHDVTYKHYLGGMGIDHLRGPMQQVTDRILDYAGIDKNAEISRLSQAPTSHKPVKIAPKPITRSATHSIRANHIPVFKFQTIDLKPRIRLTTTQALFGINAT